MRFAVAVKQVPDASEASLDENGSLIRASLPAMLDPYSENALMKILSIKREGDEVIVFTMGPPRAEEALRRCLCLGADSAYLLTDQAFAGADTWATSRVLAAFIQRVVPDADLIAFGGRASDGETGQVPFETAAMLSVRQFARTIGISRDGDAFEVVQDYGDTMVRQKAPRGSVVAFENADPCGTLMTLSGRVRGYGIEINRMDRVALGLGLYSVGLKGSKTKIVRTESTPSLRKNRKVAVSSPGRAAEIILEETEALR